MFPMMDPEKMKPMEEDEAVKKMANIGAIMEGAGASFGEEDMRLFRDAFMGTSSIEEQMEAIISRYSSLGEDDEEEDDDDDDGEIRLSDLDFGFYSRRAVTRLRALTSPINVSLAPDRMLQSGARLFAYMQHNGPPVSERPESATCC